MRHEIFFEVIRFESVFSLFMCYIIKGLNKLSLVDSSINILLIYEIKYEVLFGSRSKVIRDPNTYKLQTLFS